MTLAAGTRVGRYEIRSQLGAGGMGEVYLALDRRLRRKVALKILPAEMASSPERMRRFEQEATAAAALNHPNIAHIYEIDEAEGLNFITMEFIEGETLGEFIHNERTNLLRLLGHLEQVAEAVAKAHASGIVHRDLKPDNIMISRDGHAKILDFGLAKRLEPQDPSKSSGGRSDQATTEIAQGQSISGTVLGSVGYMSPEQALGKTKQVDHRSDIFSFGCILYEAVTGRRAFEGTDTVDTLNKIIRSPTAPINVSRPDAPSHLERIVRRCLAKDPDDRYQSIKDVAFELRDLQREMAGAAPADDQVTPGTLGSTLISPAFTASVSHGPTNSARSSSTEYLVTAFRRYKGAAALVLLFVIFVIALSMYLHSRNTEAGIDSIAVLPFVNQNGDPDSEYLSDGLTESIINSLAQLPSLRVIPRTSVFRYKGKETDAIKVGHDLAVRAVLTGRLLQHGNSLTIAVELTDVRGNRQLWGEQYDRKVVDALALQQEISREISERLRAKLTGEEQRQLARRDTSDPEAYQFYLKGRYYWNKRSTDGLKKAIEQFNQAVAKDPTYALAYVGLADCYVIQEEYLASPASETMPRAIEFATQALKLDDSLAEAHTTLANAYDQLWQWERADQEFKRAAALNPNYPTMHHWYSMHLRNVGRFDEALAEIRRAQELDPLSLVIGVNVAEIYLLTGDVNSSIDQSKRLIDLEPGYPPAHEELGAAYLRQGNHSEAIAELRKAVELSSENRQPLSTLGYGYAIAQRHAEALEVLKQLKAKYERHEAFGRDLAAVYLGLGDKDQALAWLGKDFQARVGLLVRTRGELVFESLRDDPRYIELMRRVYSNSS
jgi:serine/threonine protein kinase/tetratricopeptide (TPR) repeat protein